jgi:hypothetical protein
MDEIDAALRRSSAQDAEVAADTRASMASARNELKMKLDAARRNYNTWCEQRKDEKAIRNLNLSEFELDEAFDNYAVAFQGVTQRATRPSSG